MAILSMHPELFDYGVGHGKSSQLYSNTTYFKYIAFKTFVLSKNGVKLVEKSHFLT